MYAIVRKSSSPESISFHLDDFERNKISEKILGKIINNIRQLSELPNPNIEIKLHNQSAINDIIIFSDSIYYNLNPSEIKFDNKTYIRFVNCINNKSIIQQSTTKFNKIWNKALPPLKYLKVENSALEALRNKLNINSLISINRNSKEFDKFLGDWSLFYLESVSNIENLKLNKRISSIGRNIISINKNENGLILCTMKYFDKKQPEYAGFLNIGLKNKDYLSITLFGPNREKVLNLLFYSRSVSRGLLLGTFNVIYKRSPSDIAAGLAALEKNEKPYEKYEPGTINPFSESDISELKNRRIINYLLFRENSLISPLKALNSKLKGFEFEKSIYKGTYRVYAYGRISKQTPCISISKLEIDEFNYVTYKKKEFVSRGLSYGIVDKVESNLRIVLEDNNNEYRRLGVMTIFVGKNSPRPGSIFCGTFSGVSFHEDLPVCSLVVLEYIQDPNILKFNPEKISIYDREISKIPDPIRLFLTGKENKFIKFRRGRKILNVSDLNSEIQANVDYSKLFLNSAIIEMQNGNLNNSISMLNRSIKNGLTLQEIETFEKNYANFDNFNSLLKKKKYQDLKKNLKTEN